MNYTGTYTGMYAVGQTVKSVDGVFRKVYTGTIVSVGDGDPQNFAYRVQWNDKIKSKAYMQEHEIEAA